MRPNQGMEPTAFGRGSFPRRWAGEVSMRLAEVRDAITALNITQPWGFTGADFVETLGRRLRSLGSHGLRGVREPVEVFAPE